MKEQSAKWKRTGTSHLGKQPSHLSHTLSRPLQIFWKRRSLVPINGNVPLSNVYNNTPQLQISAGFPYDCRWTTSGAIKWGVPTRPKQNKGSKDHSKIANKLFDWKLIKLNYMLNIVKYSLLKKFLYFGEVLKYYNNKSFKNWLPSENLFEGEYKLNILQCKEIYNL